MKLLIVEDEPELQKSIRRGLELSGYACDTAGTGEEALYKVEIETYDLMILDLNLPDIFGLEVLKRSAVLRPDLKVLILTCHSELEMKISGLDLGACDYMVKPFHFEELEARIRVILRRSFTVEKPVLEYGEMQFDTVRRVLMINGEEISLTRKEAAILEYFLMNPDRLVTAEELITHAWNSDADQLSNSIRVHLTTLRKKLKTALGYNPIGNKIGEGYYLKKS